VSKKSLGPNINLVKLYSFFSVNEENFVQMKYS